MSILKEVEAAFYDIPFENSDFQNKVFVMAQHQTQARAYRACGLRMNSKIMAIKELKYSRRLEEIDIEEMRDDTRDTFQNRRNAVKIEQLLSNRTYTDKLLNDAIGELNCLYAEFKKLPKFTKEQFEAQEIDYFTKKLERLVKNGERPALESLSALLELDSFQSKLDQDREVLPVDWMEAVEETKKITEEQK